MRRRVVGSICRAFSARHARYSTFVKFSPLPHKWDVDKVPNKIYTGVLRRPETDEYYLQHVKHLHSKLASTDSWTFQTNLATDSVATVFPKSIEIGDIVEVTRRNGTISFGMVTFSPVGPMFDLLDLEGKQISANVSEVTFLLRTKNNRNNAIAESDNTEIKLKALQGFVATSLAILPDLLPYVRAAFAQYSLKSKAVAVDFEELVSSVLAARKNSGPLRPAKGIQKLAVYLAVTYYDLCFARLDTNSPIVALSEYSADAVQKVMYALTPDELRIGVAALSRKLADKEAPIFANVDYIITFLKTYVLFGDPRLASAVMNIMSEIYPERAEDQHLMLPSQVEELLKNTGFLVTSPFLTEGSLAWYRNDNPNDHLIDGLSTLQSYSGSELRPPSIDTSKFEDFDGTIYCFENDLGLSIDTNTNPDRYIMGVHIPLVPVASVLRKTNTIGLRAKSINFGTATLPLLDLNVRQQFGFSSERETPCLSIFAQVRPWNNEWEPHSVNLTWSKAKAVFVAGGFFDVNQTLSRQDLVDVNRLNKIQTVFEAQAKRRKDGCVDFDAPFMNHDDIVVAQAKLLAGEWCAEWCSKREVPVPYLSKQLLKHYPEVNDSETVNVEVLSDKPGPHEPLGANAYVPIAQAFDSALSILAQQALLSHHFSVPDLQTPPHLRKSFSEIFETVLRPRAQFTDAMYRRSLHYNVLTSLHQELHETNSFYIFHCTIKETTSAPGLAPAYCEELGIMVDVAVLANKTVNEGDTVLCTEILDLDAVQGTLVLNM